MQEMAFPKLVRKHSKFYRLPRTPLASVVFIGHKFVEHELTPPPPVPSQAPNQTSHPLSMWDAIG